jgi:hypothetical protein
MEKRALALLNDAPRYKRPRRDETETSPYTCGRCAAVFTPEGLVHLRSSSGFRHHRVSACAKHAKQGCQLCHCFYHAVNRKRGALDRTPDSYDDYLIVRSVEREREPGPRARDDATALGGISGLDICLESAPQRSMVRMLLFPRVGQCFDRAPPTEISRPL